MDTFPVVLKMISLWCGLLATSMKYFADMSKYAHEKACGKFDGIKDSYISRINLIVEVANASLSITDRERSEFVCALRNITCGCDISYSSNDWFRSIAEKIDPNKESVDLACEIYLCSKKHVDWYIEKKVRKIYSKSAVMSYFFICLIFTILNFVFGLAIGADYWFVCYSTLAISIGYAVILGIFYATAKTPRKSQVARFTRNASFCSAFFVSIGFSAAILSTMPSERLTFLGNIFHQLGIPLQ